MSIKSKMMGTTLMSLLAVVYDGRREALTLNLAHVNALQSNALCLLIVVLSFGGAIALQPIIMRVSTWLSSLLYRADASRATA